ncbi:unnamed protein product [Urochloa humidicola]
MAILKMHSTIETVKTLSDNMLAEIILRLPFKSVARSKCVSKNWCATISDGYLRRRLPLQLSVVYFPDNGGKAPRFACAEDGGDGGQLVDRDLGFFPFMDTAVVCDASNGLLLLRTAGTARFYVVDPVTRRWAALPPPSRDARLSMLAFDPSSSSGGGGGYHYHVVNFTGRWRDRGGGEVEVFSSESWAWSAPRDVDFAGVPAASLSGSMHFHGGALYALAADPDCVVRMGVTDLTCAVAELPADPAAAAGGGDARLAHSGGRLHYVASSDGGAGLKVWVLDDSSPAAIQWRLKHAAKLDGVAEGDGGEVRFMALHPEKDAAYVWSSAGRLVEYDMARKEVTGAWEFGDGGKKNRVVKTWLVPSSLYLSDSPLLGEAHVYC